MKPIDFFHFLESEGEREREMAMDLRHYLTAFRENRGVDFPEVSNSKRNCVWIRNNVKVSQITCAVKNSIFPNSSRFTSDTVKRKNISEVK